MNFHQLSLSFALAATLAAPAFAQSVDVKDAWARVSVPGQKATGAFMKITAKEGSRLVGASSPVAGVTEVHEMKMDGNVMKMRAVEGGLALPAGKTVELKPGGFHVMLMDLKAALPKDSTIPLTLVFKDAKGVESKLELKVPVATAPMHSH
jgi:periplasmic copper chaperone A